MIRDSAFAREVLDYMAVDESDTNSYRVYLDDKGRVRWSTRTDGAEVTLDRDPLSSVWQRLGARVLGWLPIEDEL